MSDFASAKFKRGGDRRLQMYRRAIARRWRATGGMLATLRTMVHALRAWPTPLGAAINTLVVSFEAGVCSDPVATVQLELVGRQVTEFAALRTSDPTAVTTV